MVVADKYQLLEPLSINSGTWKKDGSKKLLCRKVYKRSYVEDQNRQNNNTLYVIDEEATKEMQAQREENIKLNALNAQKEKVSMSDLVQTIAEVVKPKKSAEPDDTWTKEELQEYCDENGIEYAKQLGKKKLIELINNQ